MSLARHPLASVTAMSSIVTPESQPPAEPTASSEPFLREPAESAPRKAVAGGFLRRFSGLGFLAIGGLAWWWLATHHIGGVADHTDGPAGQQSASEGKDATAAAIHRVVSLPVAAQKA